jgi:GT2 family glycosyltransferase
MDSVYDKVAVIIPYYKGEEFIRDCVSSVLGDAPVRIIIVDNDPSKETLVIENNMVEVLKTQPGIGFGRAVNVGIELAISKGFEILVLLNQDTVIRKSSLKELIKHITHTNLEVYVPVLMSYDLRSIANDFLNRTLESNSTQILHEKSLIEVQKASAACMSFHINTFSEVGNFDPIFYMYGEDDDWLIRLHKLGGKIFISSMAAVGHFNNLESSIQNKRQILRWQIRAQTILGLRDARKPFLFLIKQIYRAVRYKNSPRSIIDIIKLTSHISLIKNNDKASINKRANYYLNKDTIS